MKSLAVEASCKVSHYILQRFISVTFRSCFKSYTDFLALSTVRMFIMFQTIFYRTEFRVNSWFFQVNLHKGLFYFDSRFRPVPLKQTFIGVRGTNKFKTRENIDLACYEKVLESIKKGDQVLVFVHSRNGTLKTAEKLREIAQTEGELEHFSSVEHPKYQQ